MKKEGNSSYTERYLGVGIGFAAGVVSAWIVYGIYSSWAMFSKADWWDVMTAFGTFMSAGLALWFWFYQRKKDHYHQKSMAKVKAARLAIAMRGYALQISELLCEVTELREKYNDSFYWNTNRPEFERLLGRLKPFYTDEDCEAFYAVRPKLAGWLSVSLGAYQRLADKNLLIIDADTKKYTEANIRTIGVALQTISENMRRCRGEFYNLREEFTMDSSSSKQWLEWRKKS